jgi:hypothetical protein
MTTTRLAPTLATTSSSVPRRRTLVLLAGVFLLAFAALMATGQDNEADSSLATIRASYDQGHALVAWAGYAAMAACAVLVFLGSGLRSALRSRLTSRCSASSSSPSPWPPGWSRV